MVLLTLYQLVRFITLHIVEIIFYDDIIGSNIDINVLKSDYELFTDKCKKLNIT